MTRRLTLPEGGDDVPATRSSRPTQRILNRWRRSKPPCSICGQPIAYDVHHLDPQALTLDHIVPIARGGDPWAPTNHQPAHRGCNKAKGTKSHDEARPRPTSRDW